MSDKPEENQKFEKTVKRSLRNAAEA